MSQCSNLNSGFWLYKTNKILKLFVFKTDAYVSKKSIPCCCVYPHATNLALYFIKFPFSSLFMSNTNLDLKIFVPLSNERISTYSHVLFFSKFVISVSIAFSYPFQYLDFLASPNVEGGNSPTLGSKISVLVWYAFVSNVFSAIFSDFFSLISTIPSLSLSFSLLAFVFSFSLSFLVSFSASCLSRTIFCQNFTCLVVCFSGI